MHWNFIQRYLMCVNSECYERCALQKAMWRCTSARAHVCVCVCVCVCEREREREREMCMGILKVIRASVMPLDYGGSKPHENTVGTQIRTQIIVIFHYVYKILQLSQNWDKPRSTTYSWVNSGLGLAPIVSPSSDWDCVLVGTTQGHQQLCMSFEVFVDA